MNKEEQKRIIFNADDSVRQFCENIDCQECPFGGGRDCPRLMFIRALTKLNEQQEEE